MADHLPAPADPRLLGIARARAALQEGLPAPAGLPGWIERSWQRCLGQGLRPGDGPAFDLVTAQAMRRTREGSRELLQAGTAVMARLARAIAGSGYFALMTDARGVVVAVDGAVDRSDRRADLIARVGVDLSEAVVGTTAIGTALAERMPVWLHRGEHFFEGTSCYSCAGAPLFGPDGDCVGMLDVTGVDAVERPQLRHFVTQAARGIGNALVTARPHDILLRLNWPGLPLGGEDDGLIALDEDGRITGASTAAREMTGLAPGPLDGRHCEEVIAMPWAQLADASRHGAAHEVPLWNGLTLQVAASRDGGVPASAPGLALRDVQAELIRKAVRDARGNVMDAARRLGISRATIYRRLRSGN